MSEEHSMTTPDPLRAALTPEEAVIREWVAAMTRESGAPLPPSLRRAEPLPRRRVLPVVMTLLDIIDGLRGERGPLIIGTDDAPEYRAALAAEARPGLDVEALAQAVLNLNLDNDVPVDELAAEYARLTEARP